METAKEKAAREAAEKAAAEKAQAEAAAQAAKEAEEKAAKEAAEKAAAEKAQAEAAAQAAKEAEEKAAKEAAEKAAAEKTAAEKAQETGPTGVVTVFCKLPSGMTFAMPGGDVVLRGSSGSALFNGYGITPMDAAAWEALEARYGKMDVFKKKIIFAEKNMRDGAAVAKEMSDEKTGFEGVDPKNPGKDLEPGAK